MMIEKIRALFSSPCMSDTDGVIDELFTGKKSTHRSKFRKIITDQKFDGFIEKESVRPPEFPRATADSVRDGDLPAPLLVKSLTKIKFSRERHATRYTRIG